jgi:hypothetical protein
MATPNDSIDAKSSIPNPSFDGFASVGSPIALGVYNIRGLLDFGQLRLAGRAAPGPNGAIAQTTSEL